MNNGPAIIQMIIPRWYIHFQPIDSPRIMIAGPPHNAKWKVTRSLL